MSGPVGVEQLTRRAALRQLLQEVGLRPSRRLGQHFLLDRTVLEDMVALADPGARDTVLEVGPGPGALTRLLAERAGRVVAIEKDPRFAPLLERVLAGCPHVRVVFADALSADWRALLGGTEHPLFVANLPYGITSPVLLRVVAGDVRFRRAVVMVQEEVAERLVARPGTVRYGALTVAIEARAEARIARRVPRHLFWPRPEVHSAVVVLQPVDRDLPAPPEAVARVARAAFSARRKTLLNALVHGLRLRREAIERVLEAAGIEPWRRGETLSLEEFARLAAALERLAAGGDDGGKACSS